MAARTFGIQALRPKGALSPSHTSGAVFGYNYVGVPLTILLGYGVYRYEVAHLEHMEEHPPFGGKDTLQYPALGRNTAPFGKWQSRCSFFAPKCHAAVKAYRENGVPLPANHSWNT